MTDNITIPRATVRQALLALEGWEHCDKWVWPATALEQSKRNTTESLASLRAALEQQAEPVSELQKRYLESEKAFQQQSEPVAWPQLSDDMEYAAQDEFHILPPRMKRLWKRMQELYTAPPQRKPLSDEEIKEAAPAYAVDDFLDFNAGVRFAEAAHGIKEGT